MPGTESGEVVRATPDEIELAKRLILGEAELPANPDPDAVSKQIVERIMQAETADDLFAAQELPAWQDFLDVPMRVHSFKLNRSTQQGASGVYAVVDVERLDEGARLSVTCGGKNVLGQLVTALERGWLPADVKMTAKPTGQGNTVLWLTKA